MRRAPIIASALLVVALVSACGGGGDEAASSPTPSAVATSPQTLLDAADVTVLGQKIAYPKKGQAQVSSSIVSIAPGAETGVHKHNTPMYAYILEGMLTVEYKDGTIKEYGPGTALMEAEGTWHNGKNLGDVPVRVLVVNIGAAGVKNTVAKP